MLLTVTYLSHIPSLDFVFRLPLNVVPLFEIQLSFRLQVKGRA